MSESPIALKIRGLLRDYYTYHPESLVEFWQENFKVQVEARTGIVVLHPAGAKIAPRPNLRN